MRMLHKYNLLYEETNFYILDTLKDANQLSQKILSVINFKKGKFFTYLPKDIDQKLIYYFHRGNIGRTTYCDAAAFLARKMNQNKYLNCIIDDVIRRRSDQSILQHGAKIHFFENEIYYLVVNEKSNSSILTNYLRDTDSIWHSVCILTEGTLPKTEILNVIEIEELCKKIQYILIGAYDGEGYIFWEKKQT